MTVSMSWSHGWAIVVHAVNPYQKINTNDRLLMLLLVLLEAAIIFRLDLGHPHRFLMLTQLMQSFPNKNLEMSLNLLRRNYR